MIKKWFTAVGAGAFLMAGMLFAPASAQAQDPECSDASQEAYDLLILNGYLVATFFVDNGWTTDPSDKECDKICRESQVGCRKVGKGFKKAGKNELKVVDKNLKILCKTSPDPSACKAEAKENYSDQLSLIAEYDKAFKGYCYSTEASDACIGTCLEEDFPFDTCCDVFPESGSCS